MLYKTMKNTKASIEKPTKRLFLGGKVKELVFVRKSKIYSISYFGNTEQRSVRCCILLKYWQIL